MPPQPTATPQQRGPVYQNPVAYVPRPGTPPTGTQYRYPAGPMPPTNAMGTAGLVLGLLGLFLFFLLPLGIIFSGVGISRAGSRRLPGGSAKAGLAVSLIGSFGWIMVAVIVRSQR
jgi:hypothetical protein